LEAESRRALEEDGAEVICLGCAGMAGINEVLQKRLGVPVIDGVAASIAYLNALVRCNLSTSKRRGYEQPDAKGVDTVPQTFHNCYKNK
jgi:allantoin racemase